VDEEGRRPGPHERNLRDPALVLCFEHPLPASRPDLSRFRYLFLAIWFPVIAGALYLYFFRGDFVQTELRGAMSASSLAAAGIYLVLGALRGFTLVPATFLLLVAMPFFPPWVLLALTLPGIAASSSICYWFADALRFDEIFERRYPARIRGLKSLLHRHQLPIIIGWSFFLVLPTDLICYVCGSLRIDYKKVLIGVLIGEGTVYAIYIFLGDYFLRG
jgi:uncharacterized membrane protein YdjX (TVP38/TMEM64 family)